MLVIDFRWSDDKTVPLDGHLYAAWENAGVAFSQ